MSNQQPEFPAPAKNPDAARGEALPDEGFEAGSRDVSRKLMFGACVLLLLGGGGAFAVANMQAEPEVISPRLVQSPVQSLISGKDLSTLIARPDYVFYRSDRLRASDTAESLLERLGVADPAAAAFLRSNAVIHRSLWGRHGRFVTVEVNSDYELKQLTARWVGDNSDRFQRLTVARNEAGDGFVAELSEGDLQRSSRLTSGVIESSLFAATDTAKLPDPVAIQLAEMFSTDVNFHRDLRKGDSFTVVYETLEADGEPLRSGRVLSAEFVNKGTRHQAMWFQEDENSAGAYYALDGSNLRRTFLASPLEFSRVSSSFGRRFHPIKRTWRNHNGIDYAARTGTPIRTIGDGVVQSSGWSNSYGNVVFIDHGEGRVTVYAHMQRRDVKTGERVAQGQYIGTVGSTGMSTGPHLHFEFRVNGKFMDPQIIAQQSAAAAPIDKAVRERFDTIAKTTQVKFDMAPLIMQGHAM